MELGTLGRSMALLGAALLALGLALLLIGRFPLLGHLPGNILVRRGGLIISIPLVTMLLASLLLTVVVNILLRLLRSS